MTDVKTALDASPGAFQRSIQGLGYHVQAAMYAGGFEAITGDPLRGFLFITAEKVRPYAVAVYRLGEDALEVGRRLYRSALRTWADCLERDTWPAYSDRIESITLPAWAFTDLAEDHTDENF
jgi:exodeoxyribonuclease VIII